MTKHQPYLRKAQMYKYIFIVIPAGIIVVNFFLVSRFDELKYLSIFAMLVYLFLLAVYKVNTQFEDISDDVVSSPINAKITHIETVENGTIITLKKSYFSPCEIVTCTSSDIVNKPDTSGEQVSWFFTQKTARRYVQIFAKEDIDEQGILVGITPGSATMTVFIPTKYDLQVTVGDAVFAGRTVLAGG